MSAVPSAATKPGTRAASVGVGGGPWAALRDRGGGLVWVLGGKFALLGGNAVLLLLLARAFDIFIYGLMVTVIGAQIFLSRVLMLGVDSGMVRLRTVPALRHRSRDVVPSGLRVLRFTAGALAAVTLAAMPLAVLVVRPRWPVWALAAIATGAIGTALVDYVYYYRLSELNYRAAALGQAGTALARLILTAAALVLFPRHPAAAFFAYAGTSLLSGLLQLALMPRYAFGRADKALTWRLLRFSAWQAGADIAGALSLHQGTFLLVFLGQREATGPFGLALTLSLGFFAVSQAFFQFSYPRIVRVQSPERLPSALLRTMAAALGLALACVPVIVVIGRFVPRLLRPEYHGVTPVFYWLAGSMLLMLVQAPLIAACLYLLRPNLLLLGLVMRVIFIGALGFLLAPSGGALGAAQAQFAGTALGLFFLAVLSSVGLRLARADVRLGPAPAQV